MRIFNTVKKSLLSIDLDVNKPKFHRMQLLHVVQGFVAILLQCMYFVNDANTTNEYMNSILITSIGLLIYVAYWSSIFETKTVYDFIEYYETIINGSKFGTLKNSMTKFIVSR